MARFRTILLLTLIAGVSISITACGGSPESSSLDDADPAGTELTAESYPYTHSEMNERVPAFDYIDMLGNKMSNEEISGKVTLINFWATWCGPCIVEIPDFVVLYDEWQDRPFEIVGVSMDDDGYDLVRPFAEDLAMNYPVVIDDGTLAEQFGGVYGLPTTFLVDENGTITDRFIGLFPTEELKGRLDKMVAQAEKNN
jgi:thiol-disulfide isomerase/thioredoxin